MYSRDSTPLGPQGKTVPEPLTLVSDPGLNVYTCDYFYNGDVFRSSVTEGLKGKKRKFSSIMRNKFSLQSVFSFFLLLLKDLNLGFTIILNFLLFLHI